MLEAPLEWQGLRLAPGRGGVLVTGLEGTDQRRFQRQLTVLKGYAALAADRRGERPLRLRQEDLPEREGPETLAAVWYGRAAEAEDQHGTLVACYNGFGALPGGDVYKRQVRERSLAHVMSLGIICFPLILRALLIK